MGFHNEILGLHHLRTAKQIGLPILSHKYWPGAELSK